MILEDDPLIALDLQGIVEQAGHQVVALCETLEAMRRALDGRPDFAFLDVDLPDGKSYELASRLTESHIPFAFVTGSRQGDVPEHLRHARFIPKPYGDAAIRNTLQSEYPIAC